MLDNGNAPHILDFGEPEKENSIIKAEYTLAQELL